MNSVLVLVFTAVLIASVGVVAQSKPGSLQGVWRVAEVALPGPAAQTITNPQPSLTIITARHYSRTEVHADQPRPTPADINKATVDELRAAWGPFVGEAGTYEVSGGNLLITRPIVTKNPAAMASGSFATSSFKLEGNVLWVTPQSDRNGPIANPVTVKLVRVE